MPGDNTLSTMPSGTSDAPPESSTGESSPVFNFDSNFDSTVYGEFSHVFQIPDNPEGSREFKWEYNQSYVIPRKLALVQIDSKENDEDDYSEVTSHSFSGHDDSSSFFLNPTRGGVTLNLTSFSKPSIISDAVLAIELEWDKRDSHGRRDDSTDGFDGRSISGYFAVKNPANITQISADLQSNIETYPLFAAGFEKNSTADLLATLSSSSGIPSITGGPGVPGGGDSPSVGGDDSHSNSDSHSGGGGSGSGLSTGAIVGIAIGGFVFLCLIGLLVWFLLRRRRKSQHYAASAHDAPNGYIVDKTTDADDAAAAATTGSHSPHSSPYSDDGQSPQAPPLDPHQSYHQDGQQQQQQRGLSEDGAHPPSTTTQQDGPSRSYHHLVEEGMTADDIRRLEDEERQLDAEIERARRRGS